MRAVRWNKSIEAEIWWIVATYEVPHKQNLVVDGRGESSKLAVL